MKYHDTVYDNGRNVTIDQTFPVFPSDINSYQISKYWILGTHPVCTKNSTHFNSPITNYIKMAWKEIC